MATRTDSSLGAAPLATLSVMLSEAAVTAAFLGLVLGNAGRDGGPAIFAAALLYAVAYVVWRFAMPLGSLRLFRIVVAGLAGLAVSLLSVTLLLYPQDAWLGFIPAAALGDELSLVLHAFPFGVVLLSGSLFVWWRGVFIARHPMAFRSAAVSFQIGATTLLAIYAFAALAGVSVPWGVPLAAGFFCAGLFAVALCHWQATARVAGHHIDQWLWLLVAVVAVTLALGVLVGLLFDDRFLRLLLVPIYWLGDALGALLNLLARLFPPPNAAPLIEPSAGSVPLGTEAENRTVFQLPPIVQDVGRLIWGVTFLGLIAAAAFRLLGDVVGALFRRSPDSGSATVERISGAWRTDLRALRRFFIRMLENCQFLLHRWRHRPLTAASPAVAAVRATYRDLLYWTGKRGLPRHAGETPYEYLRRLNPAFPGAAADLSLLTDSYVLARYAPDAVAEADRLRAQAIFRQLRRQLRS